MVVLNTEYFRERGLARINIIIAEATKSRIESVAKEHGVSQTDIIEVALESFKNDEEFVRLIVARREAKVDGRKNRVNKADTELLKKIKQIDPQQLQALLASVK